MSLKSSNYRMLFINTQEQYFTLSVTAVDLTRKSVVEVLLREMLRKLKNKIPQLITNVGKYRILSDL